MTDLGTLGGESSEANGINNAGQVVGAARRADGDFGAFLWQSGKGMRDLGGVAAGATGISDTGYVVGEVGMLRTGEGIRYHAFLWKAGRGMRILSARRGRRRRHCRQRQRTGRW